MSGLSQSGSLKASRSKAYPYREGMGLVNSAEFRVFFDDFSNVVTTNVPAGWTAAIIDVGATVVAAGANGSGTGELYFDSDGATEGAAIYLPLDVKLTAGKKFFMEVRVKSEVANDSDVQFGLTSLTATVNPEDLWTTTAASVISYGVLDGSAVLGMLVDAANGGTAVQAGTRSLVSNIYTTLGIFYDGSKVHGFKDGKLDLTWAGAAATIPVDTALAPFFGWRNGSAATTEGHLDYFRFVQER